jgi:AcrR family transcriptional regulator
VLASAEELFAEAGEVGFTIPEVSRRAGVSVGTIYRRFATKEDLLIAVMGRVGRDEDSNVFAAWETEDWARVETRAMIDRLVHDMSRTWRDRAPLMRAIMARRLQREDDRLFEQGLQVVKHQAALFTRAVLSHSGDIVHAEPAEAIDFAYRLITGMCARWAIDPIERQAPEPMPWDAMLDHLADSVHAYLFGGTRL